MLSKIITEEFLESLVWGRRVNARNYSRRNIKIGKGCQS